MKNIDKRIITYGLIIFLISLSYFSILQFASPYLIGFDDGYYHIKMGQIVLAQGPVKNFPWLQCSVVGKNHFVDFDFLFHLLLAPFTFINAIAGAKIFTAVLAAILVTTLYFLFSGKGPSFSFVLAMSIFASGGLFMHRLLFPRTFILSIILSLFIVHFISKRNHKMAFAVSFLYAWTYAGAVIGLGYAVVFFLVHKIRKEYFPSKVLLFVLLGWAAGLTIHPNFPNTFQLLCVKLFSVPLINWSGINLDIGGEILPINTRDFLIHTVYIFIILLSFLYLVVSKNKFISANSLSMLTITAFFIIGTMMSQRVIEYAVPFILYSCGFLYSEFKAGAYLQKKIIRFMILGLIIFSAFTFRSTLRAIPHMSGDFLKGGAIWLKDNSKEKDIVFHSGWDEFPQLFFFNSKNYYLIGLDPTYFYLYDKKLYTKWEMVRRGAIENPYSIIKGDFNARWVFSSTRPKFLKFINIIEKDNRFIRSYSDRWCVVYRVD